VIFYAGDAQRHSALKAITRLTRRGVPQDYLAHHMSQPYIVYNDLPKLERLRERSPQLYR
jgi:hypothetical protein